MPEARQTGLDGSLIPRNMKIASVNTSQLDAHIKEKVERLNLAKMAAVEAEDFDQAKHYKVLTDKLLIMGSQLQQL